MRQGRRSRTGGVVDRGRGFILVGADCGGAVSDCVGRLSKGRFLSFFLLGAGGAVARGGARE